MTDEKYFYDEPKIKQTEPHGQSSGSGSIHIPDSVFRVAIREDNLPKLAIFLYGKITDLSGKYGFCYAKNKFLAEYLNVKETTITSHVKSLKEKGYIDVEYESENCLGKRKIYPKSIPRSKRSDKVGKFKVHTNEDEDPHRVTGKEIREIKEIWNSASFVRDSGQDITPDTLPSVREVNRNSNRYEGLKNRLKNDDFDFEEIVEAMIEQPFLYVTNEYWKKRDSWGRADFDWLVANNDNYRKVLERKYKGSPSLNYYEKVKESREKKDDSRSDISGFAGRI